MQGWFSWKLLGSLVFGTSGRRAGLGNSFEVSVGGVETPCSMSSTLAIPNFRVGDKADLSVSPIQEI